MSGVVLPLARIRTEALIIVCGVIGEIEVAAMTVVLNIYMQFWSGFLVRRIQVLSMSVFAPSVCAFTASHWNRRFCDVFVIVCVTVCTVRSTT